MKTLIFGSTGQLAHEFQSAYRDSKTCYQVGRKTVDFLNPKQITKIISDFKPKIIINCSAYTAVDQAEIEPDIAMQINASAVGVIGESAKKIQASVIHFSTDYVFDGQKKLAYLETDQASPVNHYGLTKSLGEKYLADTCPSAFIFRVSWLYGVFGKNFLKTILRIAEQQPEVKVVNDQFGSPTHTASIAAAVLNAMADPEFFDKSGLYHMTSSETVSWYTFAETIIDQLQKIDASKLVCKSVLAIRSKEFLSRAVRPKHTVLNSKKLKDIFNLSLPSWNHDIERVIKVLSKDIQSLK